MADRNAAFSKFYTKHFDTVYRVCIVRLKNRADAQDVVQDTFMRAYAHEEIWADDAHARAWLITVASNLSKNRLNHWTASKRQEVEDWEAVLGAEDPGSEEDSEVLEAVMSLDEPYKTVIYLYYYEDYPTAQIAEILGKKDTTIRSQLKRGREKLEKLLRG